MTQPSDTNGEAPDLRDFVRAARCIDGLTHDVNNKLGAIMAYAELIELEEGLSAETKGMLRDILACVQHGTDLLDTIADTLGRPPARPAELDLCDLVRRMGELHSYELRQARIELEINYKGDCSPIQGLKGRISRALMIILRDAIERVRTAKIKSIRILVQGDDNSIRVVLRDTSDVQPALDAAGQGDGPDGAVQKESLLAARAHARFHGGDLNFDSATGLVLRLPTASDADD